MLARRGMAFSGASISRLRAPEAAQPSEPAGSTRKAEMSHGLRRRTSSAGNRREPPRRYQSLERVELRQDLPEHGLRRGESGTVVHVFETADAYLVEFVDPADGHTRALAELTPDQLAPAAA